MLFSSRTVSTMGAPPLEVLQHEPRFFPQWTSTAVLSLGGGGHGDDILNEEDAAATTRYTKKVALDRQFLNTRGPLDIAKMASKVLVPVAPFAKLQVKKPPPETTSGALIVTSGDPVARVAHLEHSVRFLQEQHRLMLSGLHAEIEALRERNRDLQFQLIFNKESSPKPNTPPADENVETEESRLKHEVTRLEREANLARDETRAAEAKSLQLQALIDAQAEKLRALEVKPCSCAVSAAAPPEEDSSRAELRARLAEAERLVRRLRADAERQRRELQCMKNSLHASLRASGLDSFGYQNNYHFSPVHTPDFWREPLREDFNVGSRGRSTRRPLTLPELSGQQMHRSTIYANKFADQVRPRANGYDKKKSQSTNGEASHTTVKTPEDPSVSNGQSSEVGSRPRVRRHHHRKHAPDHT